jgi:hypothetical protein
MPYLICESCGGLGPYPEDPDRYFPHQADCRNSTGCALTAWCYNNSEHTLVRRAFELIDTIIESAVEWTRDGLDSNYSKIELPLYTLEQAKELKTRWANLQ